MLLLPLLSSLPGIIILTKNSLYFHISVIVCIIKKKYKTTSVEVIENNIRTSMKQPLDDDNVNEMATAEK